MEQNQLVVDIIVVGFVEVDVQKIVCFIKINEYKWCQVLVGICVMQWVFGCDWWYLIMLCFKEQVVVMFDYYVKCVFEYECIYMKFEWQGDLVWLKVCVCELMCGVWVLDLVCGIGFWIEVMMDVCSIVGVDFNDIVLCIVCGKGIFGVLFVCVDNDVLLFVLGIFDVMMVGCWWLYVLLQDLCQYVEGLYCVFGLGVCVLWFDNQYVFGLSMFIVYNDEYGNMWQCCFLCDGSEYDVLKNFFDDLMLLQIVVGIVQDVCINWFQYYWMFEYFINQ